MIIRNHVLFPTVGCFVLSFLDLLDSQMHRGGHLTCLDTALEKWI